MGVSAGARAPPNKLLNLSHNFRGTAPGARRTGIPGRVVDRPRFRSQRPEALCDRQGGAAREGAVIPASVDRARGTALSAILAQLVGRSGRRSGLLARRRVLVGLPRRERPARLGPLCLARHVVRVKALSDRLYRSAGSADCVAEACPPPSRLIEHICADFDLPGPHGGAHGGADRHSAL